MATGNTAFQVADLDFASIKSNLITFLKSQDTFKGFDFEGSGLGVLLDILSYNTYYNSFYMNMIANESFLDSSQIRQNIISHAKAINYVPQSRRSANAVVNITVTPSQTEDQETNFIILDKYTSFLGKGKNGNNIPFIAYTSNGAYKSGNSFVFSNVTLKQGSTVTLEFLVSANNTARKFEIPSQNVDTSTLSVMVQQSISNTYTTEYQQYDDATLLRSNTTAYFVEENENLNYNIFFGDDVLGKRPANGNIVIVTYNESMGAAGNNISNFFLASTPIANLYSSNVKITTVSPSYGGTERESIENIRFRAPYAYTAQNRAVTVADYQTLITEKYQNIDSVNVWGGEDNDPPVYGKVYLSLNTKGYYALTLNEKADIINNIISDMSVLTVIPEIVDPDYTFVLVRGTVYYDSKKTTMTQNEIASDVINSVYNYSTEQLVNFDSIFKLNILNDYIVYSNPAITMIDINVYLQKRVLIQPNYSKNYVINYGCPLKKDSAAIKLYTYPQLTVLDLQGSQRNVFFEEIPASSTGVTAVNIVNPGMNYKTAPTITIIGDGNGATANCTIVNGKISSINVVNQGSEYSRATVSITGGGGTEGSATVTVSGQYGVLRSYYYKSNGQKVIVNPNAGTIDYINGIITLSSLYALGTVSNAFYDDLILTVNAVPDNDNIIPLRNQLIVIDNNNSQSIQLLVTSTGP